MPLNKDDLKTIDKLLPEGIEGPPSTDSLASVMEEEQNRGLHSGRRNRRLSLDGIDLDPDHDA